MHRAGGSETPPRTPVCMLMSKGVRRQMSLVQGEGHEGKAACALCRRLETLLKIHCSSFLAVS